MRKSLQKTPPLELNSRLARLSAGLLAAAGPRRAVKGNGAAVAARHPAATAADVDQGHARLRLLEGFLSRTEIADCAQFALAWLGETLGVNRSLCLVRPLRDPMLM